MEFNKYLRPKYLITFSAVHYLQAGISFLVTILMARYLEKEAFGNFSYAMVFANTLYIVMQYGTDKTLVRDLVQLKHPEQVISAAGWLWLLMGMLLISCIAIWLFTWSGLGATATILVLLCVLLGFIRGLSPMPWFDFKGKANYHTILLLADRLLFLAAAVTFLFFYPNEKAVIYIALAQLSARLLTLALEWNFVRSTCRLILKPSHSFIAGIIKDNTWVWLAAMGNLLMTQVNQLILNHAFGPEELAVYGFSFQVIMMIRLLQTQVLRLVSPSIAALTAKVAEQPAQVKRKLVQFCGLNAGLSVLIILPVYLLAPSLVGRFIGEAYLPAIPVLNILLGWSLLFGVAIIINQFLIGMRLQRFFFISTTLFGLLSLLLSVVLIHEFRAQGAALSLFAAHFCSVVFQLIIVLRKINRP